MSGNDRTAVEITVVLISVRVIWSQGRPHARDAYQEYLPI